MFHFWPFSFHFWGFLEFPEILGFFLGFFFTDFLDKSHWIFPCNWGFREEGNLAIKPPLPVNPSLHSHLKPDSVLAQRASSPHSESSLHASSVERFRLSSSSSSKSKAKLSIGMVGPYWTLTSSILTPLKSVWNFGPIHSGLVDFDLKFSRADLGKKEILKLVDP